MKNKKILVVDDDKIFLGLVSDALTAEGLEVSEALNGKDGLDMALKMHPDLIIADILMPIMDGMEMTEKIREDEWGKDADIIILTNLNSDQKVAEFLEKGAYDYLVKSDWPISEVIKKVKEKLSK